VTDRIEKLKKKIVKLGDRNPFVGLLRIEAVDLKEGEAILSMPVINEVHGNIFGVAHGGAIATLADTAMGVVSATLGKKTVTIDMNINYIRSAKQGDTITAVAKAIHNGEHTLVIECEHRNDAGTLLSKARGTFYVTGYYDHDYASV
jgi:acyl-CoA thioesterase